MERLKNKNPKEYWELFNQLKSKSANINCGDNIPEDRWIEHYSNLLGPKEYDPTKFAQIEERIQNLKNEPYFSELDFSVSDSEITLAIRSLKKKKAVGIDNISGEMIIASSAYMLQVYHKLSNSILCLTHYPQTWKRGILTNLFKTGDPTQTDNSSVSQIPVCIAVSGSDE